jgi:hypothetical protein
MKKIKLYEEFIREASLADQHKDVSGELLNPKKGKWMKIKWPIFNRKRIG